MGKAHNWVKHVNSNDEDGEYKNIFNKENIKMIRNNFKKDFKKQENNGSCFVKAK